MKFGIIGFGRMGKVYRQVFSSMNIDLDFVCDKKEVNIEKNVKVFQDYKVALESSNVDGIIIATHGPTHFEIMKKAIEKEINYIVCEKPLTTSLKHADEIIDKLKTSKSRLVINYSRRYSQHTLEHIPQEFCQHIFDEIHRCLKPGGAVRIMVPDFDLAKKAFLANDLNFDRDWTTGPISTKFLAVFASYYIDKLSLEEIKNKIETMGFEKYADFLTSNIPRESQKDHSGHINWWNFEKLHKMLKNAGFKQIYRSYPQKSKFPEIRGETDVRSSFDHTLWYMSVIVEAIK